MEAGGSNVAAVPAAATQSSAAKRPAEEVELDLEEDFTKEFTVESQKALILLLLGSTREEHQWSPVPTGAIFVASGISLPRAFSRMLHVGCVMFLFLAVAVPGCVLLLEFI